MTSLQRLFLQGAKTDQPATAAASPSLSSRQPQQQLLATSTLTKHQRGVKATAAVRKYTSSSSSSPPEVSTGLIEATTQLRNSVPPLHNFRLGHAVVAAVRQENGGGNFLAALRSFLTQAQEHQRSRFLAGGRKRDAAASSSSSAAQQQQQQQQNRFVLPSSVNFVSAGISFLPCDPGLLAALANDFAYELNLFFEPTTSTTTTPALPPATTSEALLSGAGNAGDNDADELTMLLGRSAVGSSMAMTAFTTTTTTTVSIPSCRGERAARLFLDASGSTMTINKSNSSSSSSSSSSSVFFFSSLILSQELLTGFRNVDTIYLSSNPAIGGLVQPFYPSPSSNSSSSNNMRDHHLLLVASPVATSLLRDIAPPSPSPLSGLLHFPRLKKLSLANCGIRHVSQLAPLRFLPSLEHLFLEGNPLCAASLSSSSSSSSSSSPSSNADQQQPYRSSVICWFSHCACCCCFGFDFTREQRHDDNRSNNKKKRLTFRAPKLVSLDGRNISESERARAISETSAHLGEMQHLRLLLQRSVLVSAVAQRLSLNAEFKYGVQPSLAELPVFARHLLPMVVAVRKTGKVHLQGYTAQFVAAGRQQQKHLIWRMEQQQNLKKTSSSSASSSSLPSDLGSRQKRAARIVLLLSILSERASLALHSPFFTDALPCFDPCLVCGNPVADSAVTTLISRSLRRLCAAATRKSRGDFVTGRMPTWADAVGETRQMLEDTVEEGIVLLINGFFSAPTPPTPRQQQPQAGMEPLLESVSYAFRNWPQVTKSSSGQQQMATTTTTTTRADSSFDLSSSSQQQQQRPLRFVCGLPINLRNHVLHGDFARSLEQRLQRGIDTSIFERDSHLSDISAMLLAPQQKQQQQSLLPSADVSKIPHRASSSVAASQDDDDDDEDSLFSLPLFPEGNEYDDQPPRGSSSSNNNVFTATTTTKTTSGGGRAVSSRQQRPAAHLTESDSEIESAGDDDDDDASHVVPQPPQSHAQQWNDDDDDDGNEEEMLIVADEFFQNELIRRCFVKWLRKWYSGFHGRRQLLAGFGDLREFEAKRAAFQRWRNRWRAVEFESASRGNLAMQCFYAWRARAHIRRESEHHERAVAWRQRREDELFAVADEFRRGSLLERCFVKMGDAASKARAERVYREQCCLTAVATTTTTTRRRALLFSAIAQLDSSSSSCGGSERLHLEDAVQRSALVLWRRRLEQRRLPPEARSQQNLRRQQQHQQQNQDDGEANNHLELTSRRVIRRARRQLWRTFVRALKSDHIRARVFNGEFAQPSASSSVVVSLGGVSVPASVLAQAERELDVSLAEISGVSQNTSINNNNNDLSDLNLLDDSAFLPLERNRNHRDGNDDDGELLLAPPPPSSNMVRRVAQSCDVSDIQQQDDAISDVGEAALKHDDRHLSPPSKQQQQQKRSRMNLRSLEVVKAFHKLAESMAKVE